MEKVKLTKNALKSQKDSLKRFQRYLPTLILKKQQLQSEILKINQAAEELESRVYDLRESVYAWVAVFAEEVGIQQLVSLDKSTTSVGNIAGIDIPIFENITFKEADYDLIKMPLWVDYGIKAAKELITLRIQLQIIQKQLELVQEELRITTQRVNLFEKVMIPDARENIRKISIFLGDLQTQAVVIGKVAKKKIEKKELAAIA